MVWQCKKCREFNYKDTVECNCKLFIITDENGEEYKVYAFHAQGAALKYAEESNCGNDYYLMNESVEILVDGKTFNISAEPDVHYSAKELGEI